MLTNDQVIERFVNGGESGKSNRMAIAEFEDWTLLWGYGHALYGVRRGDGSLFVYDGWDGYSRTTSSHMTKLKAKATSVYGEVHSAGQKLQAVVDGEGGAEVVERPPGGHTLFIVHEGEIGKSYGRLKAQGRPELEELSDRHIPSPNGAGGSSRY